MASNPYRDVSVLPRVFDVVYEASQVALQAPLRKTSLAPATLGEKKAALFFLENVTAHAHEIEFLDHNSLSEYDEDEDYTTLAEMVSFEKAQNNCDAASSQLLEELSPGELKGAGFVAAVLKTITFEDGSLHVALLVTHESGERVVVDYTARQYAATLSEEQELPWPLIKEEGEWEKLIAARALAR